MEHKIWGDKEMYLISLILAFLKKWKFQVVTEFLWFLTDIPISNMQWSCLAHLLNKDKSGHISA